MTAFIIEPSRYPAQKQGMDLLLHITVLASYLLEVVGA
jgi:hypothetical protein